MEKNNWEGQNLSCIVMPINEWMNEWILGVLIINLLRELSINVYFIIIDLTAINF